MACFRGGGWVRGCSHMFGVGATSTRFFGNLFLATEGTPTRKEKCRKGGAPPCFGIIKGGGCDAISPILFNARLENTQSGYGRRLCARPWNHKFGFVTNLTNTRFADNFMLLYAKSWRELVVMLESRDLFR